MIFSFIFVGVITTVCCSGGLAGLLLLTCSISAPRRDHLKAAVLIGAIASGVFFGVTLADDHVWLGVVLVAIITLGFAFVAKTYRQSTTE